MAGRQASADVLEDHCAMEMVGLGLKTFISATDSSFVSSQITAISFKLHVCNKHLFMCHAVQSSSGSAMNS